MQVLDAHAVFVYLEKEPGYEKVRDALSKAAESQIPLLISSVNWGEIYYITLRERGVEFAEHLLKTLDGFPIDVMDVDQRIAKQAATFKAAKKMSYADCFAAALAKVMKAELLTGDKEFREVRDEIRIVWVGS